MNGVRLALLGDRRVGDRDGNARPRGQVADGDRLGLLQDIGAAVPESSQLRRHHEDRLVARGASEDDSRRSTLSADLYSRETEGAGR